MRCIGLHTNSFYGAQRSSLSEEASIDIGSLTPYEGIFLNYNFLRIFFLHPLLA